MAEVDVLRVGTQVVVRVSGRPDDRDTDRFATATTQVQGIVTSRVVIDLADADPVGDAVVDFVRELQAKWRVRLINAPALVRRQCAVGEVS